MSQDTCELSRETRHCQGRHRTQLRLRPSVRAAFGGNLKPATHGGTGRNRTSKVTGRSSPELVDLAGVQLDARVLEG